MPISIPLSPTLLQPLLPWREAFASTWETILASTASASAPALAAAHLSRLAEQGFGSGVVISTPALCRDLLFLLGSSQHLTTVLLSQGRRWEAVFLQDRQSSLKGVDARLSTLRAQLPL